MYLNVFDFRLKRTLLGCWGCGILAAWLVGSLCLCRAMELILRCCLLMFGASLFTVSVGVVAVVLCCLLLLCVFLIMLWIITYFICTITSIMC